MLPPAGVDKRSEATIVRLLHELAGQGCAVVVATHDLQALPELARHVVLLRRAVLFHGPVSQGLTPEHLVRTFGLDVMARTRADDVAPPARAHGTGAAPPPSEEGTGTRQVGNRPAPSGGADAHPARSREPGPASSSAPENGGPA